jgi:hypothetical protein
MPEVYITSVKKKSAKKSIQIVYRLPKSSQRCDETVSLTHNQRSKTKNFITTMDECSSKCARYGRNQNKKQLSATNKTAYKKLQKYGASLFKFLKTTKTRPVKTLEDIFGDELGRVILNLDEQT